MTPGLPDPRPSPWGPLSVLWWPVLLLVLWPLAGLSLLVWPARRHEAPGNGHSGGGSYPRAFRAKPAVLGPLAAVLALAGCSPDFRHSMGGPPQTATLSPPRPPVTVPNPFWCRRASP